MRFRTRKHNVFVIRAVGALTSLDLPNRVGLRRITPDYIGLRMDSFNGERGLPAVLMLWGHVKSKVSEK